MIRSMTGFGRGSASVNGLDLWAEVKTVNNRYLKTSLRLPELLSPREMAMETAIRAVLKRGSVYMRVWIGGQQGEVVKDYRVDTERAGLYVNEFAALAKQLKLHGSVSLDALAQLPGVVLQSEPGCGAEDEIANAADKALASALDACQKMREAEGAALAVDLKSRAKTLLGLNERAKSRSPFVVEEYRVRLRERISKLMEGTGSTVREEDIARETAHYADRCDVSEETTRLEHHCKAMLKLLEGDGNEAGRKLDFMAQEMLREANTMGSKSGDVELTSIVLDMKSEIDKVKEQVQNIE